MSDELLYDERREWAKMLYTKLGYSYCDVALAVNVEEAIIRQWIKAYAWNEMKTSLLISKNTQLHTLFGYLDVLTNGGENEKVPGPKDVDAYSRCISHINALEPFPAIADIIEIFELFLQWLRKEDLVLAQKIIPYLDAFLQQRIAA